MSEPIWRKPQARFWAAQCLGFILTSGTDAEFACIYLIGLIPLNIAVFLCWPGLRANPVLTPLIDWFVILTPIGWLMAAFAGFTSIHMRFF